MSFLSIITTLILIIFWFTQRNTYHKKWKSTFQSSMNNIIIFILLPISFSRIAVISNYLFEVFSDNLYWFTILYIPLWILSIIYSGKIIKDKKLNILQSFWTIIMCVVLVFWYFIAISQSHHESDFESTPAMTDPVYILLQSSVHLIIILTLILQFSMWKHYYIIKKIVIIFLFLIYMFIGFS